MKQLASGLARHDFFVLLDVSSDAESCRQTVVKVAGKLSEVKKQK
jgi:broad specificity phosphatase PhoE